MPDYVADTHFQARAAPPLLRIIGHAAAISSFTPILIAILHELIA